MLKIIEKLSAQRDYKDNDVIPNDTFRAFEETKIAKPTDKSDYPTVAIQIVRQQKTRVYQ